MANGVHMAHRGVRWMAYSHERGRIEGVVDGALPSEIRMSSGDRREQTALRSEPVLVDAFRKPAPWLADPTIKSDRWYSCAFVSSTQRVYVSGCAYRRRKPMFAAVRSPIALKRVSCTCRARTWSNHEPTAIIHSCRDRRLQGRPRSPCGIL